MSNNEIKNEKTLDELRNDLVELNNKIEELNKNIRNYQCEIDYQNDPKVHYYDKKNNMDEYDEAVRKIEPAKRDVEQLLARVPKLNDLIYSTVIKYILNDLEPELSADDVQRIIDEYSPLVDQYLKEKNFDQERITELGDPKDEDGYDELREAYGDLKDDEEKLMECTKILNYAQCYLPNEKKL